MIIQKTGVFKFLRYLGIFCALAMGFVSIVATSEEDAADALGIDTDFSTDEEVALPDINVTKSAQPGAAAVYEQSGTTTIQEALDANNIDIPEDVDLTAVTINSMGIEYKDTTWEPDTMDSISCDLTINAEGDTYYAIFSGLLINAVGAGSISVTLTTEQIAVWNHFIAPANWNEEFDYTLACDDDAGAITAFDITLNVELGITINGDYF